MLEEPDPERKPILDPPKFTIQNGYIFYLYSFCVGLRYGILGLYLIGEPVDDTPWDMRFCIYITVEDPPPSFENVLKVETEEPMCPFEEAMVAASQVNNSKPPRYYIEASISEPGDKSCPDVRFPDGLTLLVPDLRPISGSVLTIQSTKTR
jgi:hypothetical protein